MRYFLTFVLFLTISITTFSSPASETVETVNQNSLQDSYAMSIVKSFADKIRQWEETGNYDYLFEAEDFFIKGEYKALVAAKVFDVFAERKVEDKYGQNNSYEISTFFHEMNIFIENGGRLNFTNFQEIENKELHNEQIEFIACDMNIKKEESTSTTKILFYVHKKQIVKIVECTKNEE